MSALRAERNYIMLKKYLEAGKIVGTHGIRGEVRVETWCDSPVFFSKLKKVYIKNGETELLVKSRPHKNIAIMKIAGIDTIEAADKYLGKVVYMDREHANLPEDTFFIVDLIGLDVVDMDSGSVYGKISDVFKTGANDVYEVTDNENKKYLVPVIDDVVKEINPKDGFVKIIPMKGIFDDED